MNHQWDLKSFSIRDVLGNGKIMSKNQLISLNLLGAKTFLRKKLIRPWIKEWNNYLIATVVHCCTVIKDISYYKFTLNIEHWTFINVNWILNAGHLTLNIEYWTMNNKQWILNIEHWTLNTEYWPLGTEHLKVNNEHWVLNIQ